MNLDWNTTLLGILLAGTGFFLQGVAREIKENTKALGHFSTQLTVLQTIVESIQKESERSAHEFRESLKRQDAAIELVRHRLHFVVNKMSAIRLKLEKMGQTFHGEKWDFPGSEESSD